MAFHDASPLRTALSPVALRRIMMSLTLTGIEGFSRRKPVVVRTNAQPGSGVAWPAATLSPQKGFAAVGVAGPTAPLSPIQ